MGRRRFDHFVVELSVALGLRVPRYAFWLRMREAGFDPEDLSRGDALSFCDGHLADFLWEIGASLRGRPLRRLRREIDRFDPNQPTPYERMERLADGPS